MQHNTALFTYFLMLQVLLSGCGIAPKTARNPKPLWPYATQSGFAHLYTFNPNYPADNETGKPETSIIINGALNPQATEIGTLLAPDAQAICQIMSQSSNIVAMGLSKCFIPRHGIVWYTATGKPQAYLSICFECDRIDAYPAIQYTHTHSTNSVWKDKDISKAEADIAAVKQILLQYVPILK